MIIGLLTDTHLPNVIRQLEELGPEPTEFFRGVDLILHAGDLTAPYVLDWLEQFAPVLCSTGNNDPIPDSRCEDVQVKELRLGTVGLLELTPLRLSATVFPLGHTPARPNPGQPLSLRVHRNGNGRVGRVCYESP